MNAMHPHLSGTVEKPVTLSTEPYISAEYAREERDKLWLKAWQMACREEEIPNVGDFYTYEIQDQSVIVTRTAENEIRAYHNACRHRGRRLTNGTGRASQFICPYHGWKWETSGKIAEVPGMPCWDGALSEDRLALKTLSVDVWGGFVFVNFDTECEPLEAFLGNLGYWIGPFELDKMRYKWRQWLTYDCNWKVAVEAFIEGYHGPTTHPQLSQFITRSSGSGAQGLHGRMFMPDAAGGGIGTSVGDVKQIDMRTVPHLALKQQMEELWSNATDTFIEAGARLPDMLPETATSKEISIALMQTAHAIDSEKGVQWPAIDPAHLAQAGINWHLFPNVILLPNVTFCLGFRMRPDGFNPDRCIMEVFALERYAEGAEPQTRWEHKQDMGGGNWPPLLKQDFRNLHLVQAGMKSVSHDGLLPNPDQEACVINFQRNLATYMGKAGPIPLST